MTKCSCKQVCILKKCTIYVLLGILAQCWSRTILLRSLCNLSPLSACWQAAGLILLNTWPAVCDLSAKSSSKRLTGVWQIVLHEGQGQDHLFGQPLAPSLIRSYLWPLGRAAPLKALHSGTILWLIKSASQFTFISAADFLTKLFAESSYLATLKSIHTLWIFTTFWLITLAL